MSPLLYNVTDIEFDFNDDLDPIYSISESDQELVTREHLGVWEADNENDMMDEITAASGWLIKNIYFEIQLK